MSRGAALAVAAAALLVAGCGGGSSDEDATGGPPPKPKESIQAFAGRLATAVEADRAGNCKAIEELTARGAKPIPCGGRTKQLFEGFDVTGSVAFGSGGIVEFDDAEVQQADLPPGTTRAKEGARGVYPVALDAKGNWTLAAAFTPILPAPTVGRRPASFAGFDRAARQFVDSVRRKDCALFYTVTLTPGLKLDAACSSELNGTYAPLTAQLKKHEDARPVRLGGTDQLAFYALRTGGEYRTLAVMRNAPREQQPYLALGTLRGPSS